MIATDNSGSKVLEKNMAKLEFRELELTDKEAWLRFAKDWRENNTSLFRIMEESDFEKVTDETFVDYQAQLRREETTAEQADWSTCTKYFLFVDGVIVGNISCRWQIEKGILLEWGGHIGYGVAPSFRGQHFAEEMVRFSLEKYRARGILRVMISANETNLASRKTIERSGGVLENIIEIDGNKICRYWIDLNK